MNFIEQQFPTDVRPEASGGPEYKTTVVDLRSGASHRNSLWADPVRNYSVTLGPRDRDSVAAILDFVANAHGGLNGFRMKDWSDYDATDEFVGVGNGSDYWFRLNKAYGAAYTRRILKPVLGTVTVYLDSVPLSGSAWALDTRNGVIVFQTAPGVGVQITADFEFDVPVYFADDMTEVLMLAQRLGQWSDIRLREDKIKEDIDVTYLDSIRP